MKGKKAEAAEQLLGEALQRAVEHGRQERAGAIRKALHALNPAKKKPRPSWPAILAARRQSHDGPRFGIGLCLQRVRMCFDIGPAAADAIGAWNASPGKHPETDPTKIPRGVPVLWSGGSERHGHIAISTGSGKCWSSDILRGGYFDYVDIALIHEKWGLTLLGWIDVLNGTPITPGVLT